MGQAPQGRKPRQSRIGLREQGLNPDEPALVEVVDGRVRIQPANRVVEQPQAEFRHDRPQGSSLADELIAGRRHESETG
jgi:hypothetical protein